MLGHDRESKLTVVDGRKTVSSEQFWIGEQHTEQLWAIVDLDAGEAWPDQPVLPAYPVIGLGSCDAPGAEHVDTIVEAPANLEAVLAQIEANPLAASIIVQLLRMLPALDLEAGLVAESLAYATLQGSNEHREWMGCKVAQDQTNPPGHVQVERNGNDLHVVLDRPVSANAIDRPMRDALYEAFQVAAIDTSIERVVLRSQGKAFSLGADLAEFGTTTDPATAHAIRAATLPAHIAVRISERLEARIQGACVGSGLELAAFASRIAAGPKAWFQLPELSMGILPGAGGCVSLTRRIGRQRTALMILSGKRISARTALEWGLVDAIEDDLT